MTSDRDGDEVLSIPWHRLGRALVYAYFAGLTAGMGIGIVLGLWIA